MYHKFHVGILLGVRQGCVESSYSIDAPDLGLHGCISFRSWSMHRVNMRNLITLKCIELPLIWSSFGLQLPLLLVSKCVKSFFLQCITRNSKILALPIQFWLRRPGLMCSFSKYLAHLLYDSKCIDWPECRLCNASLNRCTNKHVIGHSLAIYQRRWGKVLFSSHPHCPLALNETTEASVEHKHEKKLTQWSHSIYNFALNSTGNFNQSINLFSGLGI